MTVRYVGPGGSDAASGLTWALRKETLNGVEDTPVVAGDTIYVGPGVYRETLTCDVDGSNGNIITYFGDVTGKNTDGVGGLIRITGTDDDTVEANDRQRVINASDRVYRTFKGFFFDSLRYLNGPNGSIYIDLALTVSSALTNIVVEDCVFSDGQYGPSASYAEGAVGGSTNTPNGSSTDVTVRRCISGFYGPPLWAHRGSGELPNTLVENCIDLFAAQVSLRTQSVHGLTARHCTLMGTGSRIMYSLNKTAAENTYMYDCLFADVTNELFETNLGAIVEDYNYYSGVSIENGFNTNDERGYVPIYPPLLYQGIQLPWDMMEFIETAETFLPNTSSTTEDVYGFDRPVSGKRTKGAVQFKVVERDGDFFFSGISSMRMNDFSRTNINSIVRPSTSYKVSVRVYREANYTGTTPQLIIKRPGQSDITVADSGSTGAWNFLEVAFDTEADDRYIQIELKSNNTATSGSYKVWFDKLEVKTSKAAPTLCWMTNEILLYDFGLKRVVDPWIAPQVPTPDQPPLIEFTGPLPTAFKVSAG